MPKLRFGNQADISHRKELETVAEIYEFAERHFLEIECRMEFGWIILNIGYDEYENRANQYEFKKKSEAIDLLSEWINDDDDSNINVYLNEYLKNPKGYWKES